MPVQGIKTVASSRNGVGAFILQCKRLDFHYCDWAGSSRGMNAFLKSSLLPTLTASHPSTEFRVSPRPNRHPVLRAFYINGREKAVCVRNMEPANVLKKAQALLQNSGEKNRKIKGCNVLSTNESVRGVWSPMHDELKAL